MFVLITLVMVKSLTPSQFALLRVTLEQADKNINIGHRQLNQIQPINPTHCRVYSSLSAIILTFRGFSLLSGSRDTVIVSYVFALKPLLNGTTDTLPKLDYFHI